MPRPSLRPCLYLKCCGSESRATTIYHYVTTYRHDDLHNEFTRNRFYWGKSMPQESQKYSKQTKKDKKKFTTDSLTNHTRLNNKFC